jgi:hypothetical protein
MSKSINLIMVVLFFILSGCKKDATQKDAEFGVVINELMPVSSSVASYQNGEYENWIELYNKIGYAIDLSRYYLTDSKPNLLKWKFPPITVILADSFLIVWADNNRLKMGLHANYKLSSQGETVIFQNSEFVEIDRVTYPPLPLPGQPSYARVPNGNV